jgi:hypothetical protein
MPQKASTGNINIRVCIYEYDYLGEHPVSTDRHQPKAAMERNALWPQLANAVEKLP